MEGEESSSTPLEASVKAGGCQEFTEALRPTLESYSGFPLPTSMGSQPARCAPAW
jgi:hypothetical protein